MKSTIIQDMMIKDEAIQNLRYGDNGDSSQCLRHGDKDEEIQNLRYGDKGEASQFLKYGGLMLIVLKVIK